MKLFGSVQENPGCDRFRKIPDLISKINRADQEICTAFLVTRIRCSIKVWILVATCNTYIFIVSKIKVFQYVSGIMRHYRILYNKLSAWLHIFLEILIYILTKHIWRYLCFYRYVDRRGQNYSTVCMTRPLFWLHLNYEISTHNTQISFFPEQFRQSTSTFRCK